MAVEFGIFCVERFFVFLSIKTIKFNKAYIHNYSKYAQSIKRVDGKIEGNREVK